MSREASVGVEPVLPGGDEIDRPPVIVVASGKGGVGKSVIATLLASALAERGERVLLLDGSQNLGHLHVLLGIPVKSRLEQLARGEVAASDLLHRVSERLWLVPADSGTELLHALPTVDRARLHHRLAELYDDFGVVVVDAGPGVESVMRLLTLRGTRLAVVTVPEIGALTDAYALVKLVHAQLPALPIDLLVNRAADPAEAAETHRRLAAAVERFLGRRLGSLGSISEHARLHDALQRPGRLLQEPALGQLRAEIAALSLVRDPDGRRAVAG
jgi:flagellar biosynthesis protein FlhG